MSLCATKRHKFRASRRVDQVARRRGRATRFGLVGVAFFFSVTLRGRPGGRSTSVGASASSVPTSTPNPAANLASVTAVKLFSALDARVDEHGHLPALVRSLLLVPTALRAEAADVGGDAAEEILILRGLVKWVATGRKATHGVRLVRHDRHLCVSERLVYGACRGRVRNGPGLSEHRLLEQPRLSSVHDEHRLRVRAVRHARMRRDASLRSAQARARLRGVQFF